MTKIQISVFKPKFFINTFLNINFEWRSFRLRKNFNICYENFNITCINFTVSLSLSTFFYFTCNFNNEFITNFISSLYGGFINIRVKDNLGKTIAVSKIDKNDSTMVSTTVDPSTKGNSLAYVLTG